MSKGLFGVSVYEFLQVQVENMKNIDIHHWLRGGAWGAGAWAEETQCRGGPGGDGFFTNQGLVYQLSPTYLLPHVITYWGGGGVQDYLVVANHGREAPPLRF